MNMNGLWADSWFYISVVGFLLSSVLFVFLLGQYRAAVEAAEDEEPVQPVPVAPAPKLAFPAAAAEKSEKTMVIPPEEKGPVPVVSVFKAEKVPSVQTQPLASAAEPAKALPSPDAEKKKSGATTSSEISPAVVYLQNIKMQMEKLDKDLLNIKSLASQQAAQGELILRRLGELVERVRGIEAAKSPGPVAPGEKSETAAPAAAPAAEPPAAAPVVSEPAALPPEASPAATLFIEPTVAMQSFQKTQSAVEPAAAPAAAPGAPQPSALELKINPPEAAHAPAETAKPAVAPPPHPETSAEEPRSARKGPVWPI